ncbi:MAG: hypothetical protein F6K28_27465, partial [Microcoleus sp. SIO2G3]|nr:hypothetical protein [Microcoleus sp. SIO2G3]
SDLNILTFPISATYTKQGTLDGKLGENVDPSYPNAKTYSPDRSYFKPIEAYNLKRQIQREEEQIRTFYDQWDAGSRGRRTNAAQFSSDDMATGQAIAKLPKIEKRNLVNTYVWTADGGLFAETQETLDVMQESMGGSYSFTGMAGIIASGELAVTKVGGFFNLDALFGGHLNLTVTKNQSSETAFGVEVEVDGVESDVFERDDKDQICLDYSRDPRNPKPKRKAGKVDAYRFMTFYLEPRPDSFEQFFNTVVDPIWLEQDDRDPAAVALRQARQAAQQSNTKPPCWRIMHRVTYVSRVLAENPSSNAPSLERKLKDINIDSNYELIKRLQPYVVDKVGSYPDFARAVRDAIKEYLPELQPHTESILQFMVLYFDVNDTIAAPVDPSVLPDNARQPNLPPTVKAGSDALTAAGVSLALQGEVSDDRLSLEALLISWSKVSGEGAVSFEPLNQPSAKATFSQAGRYVLRLTASDGFRTASDDISVLVNEPPKLNTLDPIALPSKGKTTLTGQVLSEGLGDRAQGSLQYQWQQISGPVPASIAQPQQLETDISFTESGLYVLRLTATNRTAGLELSSSVDLEIDVATRVRNDL